MAESEQMSLAGILSDEPEKLVAEPKAPAPEAAPEAPKQPEVERPQSKRSKWLEKEQAAQGMVRDPETGQFSKKEEPKAEPAKEAQPVAEPKKEEPKQPAAPQQEFTEKEKAFLRAAQEERNKRQALEKRLAEMEAKLPKEPEKTFWDDPEAALQRQQQETRTALLNERLKTAELIARQKYTDFDEKIATFGELIQSTPGLHVQWLASPDPAEFAYRMAKNHKELQEVGNLDGLRKKIEQETEARVRTKIEAELKEKAEALAKERAALPGSLSEARSVGNPTKPIWNGPPSLEEILKG